MMLIFCVGGPRKGPADVPGEVKRSNRERVTTSSRLLGSQKLDTDSIASQSRCCFIHAELYTRRGK